MLQGDMNKKEKSNAEFEQQIQQMKQDYGAVKQRRQTEISALEGEQEEINHSIQVERRTPILVWKAQGEVSLGRALWSASLTLIISGVIQNGPKIIVYGQHFTLLSGRAVETTVLVWAEEFHDVLPSDWWCFVF